MKISILTPNMAGNCLGRAWVLASILSKKYDVEICGPLMGKKIWSPLKNSSEVKFKAIPARSDWFGTLRFIELYKAIDGDLVYASKPLISSYGVALLLKLFKRKKVILDIDDWEWGFVMGGYRKKNLLQKVFFLISGTLKIFGPGSIVNVVIMELFISKADLITVSNRFLGEKYDTSHIIVHSRDSNLFDPTRFDSNSERNKLGIPKDEQVVLFLGSPRRYKGVEDLVLAMTMVDELKVKLLIVGLDETSYSREIKKLLNDKLENRYYLEGMVNFSAVPGIIACSNIVAVPQRRTIETVGQLPAKIFDAMAMAKPVVVSNTSILPEIVGQGGIVFRAGDPYSLAEKLSYLTRLPEKAIRMGELGRRRFNKLYSHEVMFNKLDLIISEIFTE